MRPERLLLVLLVLLLPIPGHVAAEETAAVHILKVAAPIAPGVAGFVADALEVADLEKAAQHRSILITLTVILAGVPVILGILRLLEGRHKRTL